FRAGKHADAIKRLRSFSSHELVSAAVATLRSQLAPAHALVSAALAAMEADSAALERTRAEGQARERAQHDQRARDAVAEARRAFDGGDAAAAVKRLSQFSPPHNLVNAALGELSAELAEREQQERARAAQAAQGEAE